MWSAGISELPLPGSMVGPTFACIIGKQFHNFRFGDRFWYENGGWPSSFTLEQLNEIRKVKLSRLICDNGDDVDSMQVSEPVVRSGVIWLDFLMNSTTDLWCIQCLVVDMTLDTPKISCTRSTFRVPFAHSIHPIVHHRCTPWCCPTTTSTPACPASPVCSRASTSPSGGTPASTRTPDSAGDPRGDPSKDSNQDSSAVSYFFVTQ